MVIGVVVALVLTLGSGDKAADAQSGTSSSNTLGVNAPSSDTSNPAHSDLSSKSDDELKAALPSKNDFPSDWDVTEIGPDGRAPTATKASSQFSSLGYAPAACKDAFFALMDLSGAWTSKELRGELVAALVASGSADKDTSNGVGIVKDLETRVVQPLQPLLSTCSSFQVTGAPRGDFTATVSKVELSGAQADKVLGVTLRLSNNPMLSLIVAKVRGVYVIAGGGGDVESLSVKLASTTVGNLSKM